MTSETWPPPRPEEGNFPPFLCKFDKWLEWFEMVLWVHLLYFFTIVPDDELDIDVLDEFVKRMRGLHPKPEDEGLRVLLLWHL
jgi:hypothetical protein